MAPPKDGIDYVGGPNSHYIVRGFPDKLEVSLASQRIVLDRFEAIQLLHALGDWLHETEDDKA